MCISMLLEILSKTFTRVYLLYIIKKVFADLGYLSIERGNFFFRKGYELRAYKYMYIRHNVKQGLFVFLTKKH